MRITMEDTNLERLIAWIETGGWSYIECMDKVCKERNLGIIERAKLDHSYLKGERPFDWINKRCP